MISFLVQRNADAQYYNATHRQTAEEMALLKSQNIRVQAIYLEQAGNSVPYEVNNFDTGGRVILIANQKHHEHFAYDNNGRINHWVDSANDGRRFEKFEYYFGYDEKGMVNAYKTSNSFSKFYGSVPDLKEDIIRNNRIIEKHSYNFNNEGRLTSELFSDTSGKPVYSNRLFYNKYGDLGSQITVNAVKDCKGDSTAVINTYNNKGKIVHKQLNRTIITCGSQVTILLKKTITESYSYTYNAGGQLVKETMTSTLPGAGYRKEYQYGIEGLIFKELNFDDKGKSASDLIYSYVYYSKKR